jgi:hypothetical protein
VPVGISLGVSAVVILVDHPCGAGAQCGEVVVGYGGGPLVNAADGDDAADILIDFSPSDFAGEPLVATLGFAKLPIASLSLSLR